MSRVKVTHCFSYNQKHLATWTLYKLISFSFLALRQLWQLCIYQRTAILSFSNCKGVCERDTERQRVRPTGTDVLRKLSATHWRGFREVSTTQAPHRPRGRQLGDNQSTHSSHFLFLYKTVLSWTFRWLCWVGKLFTERWRNVMLLAEWLNVHMMLREVDSDGQVWVYRTSLDACVGVWSKIGVVLLLVSPWSSRSEHILPWCFCCPL